MYPGSTQRTALEETITIMGLNAQRHPDKGEGGFTHRFNVMEQVADKVIEAYTAWTERHCHARLLEQRARFSVLAEAVRKGDLS